MSPKGTPPEIGKRESQAYSRVRLTPSPSSPPPDINQPLREATPFLKQVSQWGNNHPRYGLHAIDKQLKKEEEEEEKKRKTKKTNKTRTRK